jgi:hypothetical protein
VRHESGLREQSEGLKNATDKVLILAAQLEEWRTEAAAVFDRLKHTVAPDSEHHSSMIQAKLVLFVWPIAKWLMIEYPTTCQGRNGTL